MREYAVIRPGRWNGPMGLALRGVGPEARDLLAYLETAPEGNILGLYYAPIPMVCHRLGLSESKIRKAAKALWEAGLACYDHRTGEVFVPHALEDQFGGDPKPGDKRLSKVRKLAVSLARQGSAFAPALWERYGDPFQLGDPPEVRGLNGARKGEQGSMMGALLGDQEGEGEGEEDVEGGGRVSSPPDEDPEYLELADLFREQVVGEYGEGHAWAQEAAWKAKRAGYARTFRRMVTGREKRSQARLRRVILGWSRIRPVDRRWPESSPKWFREKFDHLEAQLAGNARETSTLSTSANTPEAWTPRDDE